MARLLDNLVWQHLLREPCQADRQRCPERARQCAACPHRRRLAGPWAIRLRDLATIPSLTHRGLLGSRRRELRPGLQLALALLSLCLSAYLGWELALFLAH
jgi:hypothetical protein